jgi:hypothetical protein
VRKVIIIQPDYSEELATIEDLLQEQDYVAVPNVISSSDVSNSVRFEVLLYGKTGPIVVGDITPGTVTITRTRAGVATPIIGPVACTEAAGKVYYDYTFAPANWATDDSYMAVFSGQEIVVDGVTRYPAIPPWIGVIMDITSIEGKIDVIDGLMDVPAIDGAPDLYIRDVVGNKSDTTAGDSIVSLVKAVQEDVGSGASATKMGSITGIIGNPEAESRFYCGQAGSVVAADWAALTNTGMFNITVDGLLYEDINPDFTGDVTMADVATSITLALAGGPGGLCTFDVDMFIIDGAQVGQYGEVQGLTTPTGGGVDLSDPSWLNSYDGYQSITDMLRAERIEGMKTSDLIEEGVLASYGLAPAPPISSVVLSGHSVDALDKYIDQLIYFVDGPCAGFVRKIISVEVSGFNLNVYLDRTLSVVPDAGDNVKIIRTYITDDILANSAVDRVPAPTTTSFAIDDFTASLVPLITSDFNPAGCLLKFTSGQLKGVTRPIQSFDYGTLIITIDPTTPFPVAPAENDTFVILPGFFSNNEIETTSLDAAGGSAAGFARAGAILRKIIDDVESNYALEGSWGVIRALSVVTDAGNTTSSFKLSNAGGITVELDNMQLVSLGTGSIPQGPTRRIVSCVADIITVDTPFQAIPITGDTFWVLPRWTPDIMGAIAALTVPDAAGVAAGLLTVPLTDSALNVIATDVIGSKADTVAGDSLVALAKNAILGISTENTEHETTTLHIGDGSIADTVRAGLLLRYVADNGSKEATTIVATASVKNPGALVESTTTFNTTLNAGIATTWSGHTLMFTSGANINQARRIQGMVSDMVAITAILLTDPLDALPTVGDTFVILSGISPDVYTWATQALTDYDVATEAEVETATLDAGDGLIADHARAGELLRYVADQVEKSTGETPGVGTATQNWNAAEADIISIGANNTMNKLHSLFISINNITAGSVVTLRMYTQVNGTERKFFEDAYTKGTDPDGICLISGTIGVHEVVRVTAQSNTAADDGKGIDYDYMLETM